MKLQMRDYQSSAIKQVYGFFRIGLKSVLVFSPTGSGKTIIACQIISDAVAKGRRVLFLVHRTTLIRQTASLLENFFGVKCGIIWGSHPQNPDAPVQIAMVQTLQNRELPPDIGLVVLDEAHTSSYYAIFQRVIDNYSGGILALSPTFFIGLSATPWRTKKKEGYCQYFQAIAKAPSPDQLIDLGHLAPARSFGWNGLADFDQLESGSDGDFSQESMKSLCDSDFNKKVIEKFVEFVPGRKAIAFCANCVQAEDLTEKFLESGIVAETVIGSTLEENRELVFNRFKSGETQAIVSVGVLCEGFDETSVDAVLLARPTKSIALLIQMSGRGLRLHEGKEDCYLLDFCQNFERLGLPTKERPISLCPNTKRRDFEPTKTCPRCNAVVPIFAQICPHCGHEFGEDQGEGEQLTLDLDKAKFGEILSPEQKNQCRYLRTQLRNAFKGGRDVGRVSALFFNKFNRIPPGYWFQDAIFRRGRFPHPDQRKADQYALIAHVRKTRGNATSGYLGEMLRNEFGKAFYSLDQIDWWNELGIEKTKDYQLVKEAYQKALATADRGKAALLNLAIEEARAFCTIATIQQRNPNNVYQFTKERQRAEGRREEIQ